MIGRQRARSVRFKTCIGRPFTSWGRSIAEKYLAAGRLLLPHGEEDREKTYTMPDPDGYAEAWAVVRAVAYPPVPLGPVGETVTVSTRDLRRVLDLADGYLTLTTYALGVGACVRKLRDIWRSRRERGVA